MRQLILIVPALLFFGCSDAKKTDEEKVAQTPKLITTPIAESSNETTAVSNKPTGKIIFAQRCSSCHGSRAEKKAMNVSQIIAGWDKEQTLQAFKGYESGSYGGKMKSIMKSQVSLLDDEQKETIADYIATLQ